MKKPFLALGILAFHSYALQISPPMGWQKQFNIPAGVLEQYVSPKSAAGFTPNLTIAEKPEDSTTAGKKPLDLLAYMENAQARIFPMYKVVRKSPFQAGKVPGALLVITYAYGPLDVAAFQFVFANSGRLTTVVYSCLSRDLAGMSKEFEGSLASLSLAQP